MKIEKDRETTEKRLLTAVGEIVEESGLESLGINAVAQRAGVSKMLIYRYFGSLEDLIAQYIIQRDKELMFKIIKSAFMQRRKTLINALNNAKIFQNKEEGNQILESLKLDESVRAEKLTLENFADITNRILKKGI